jgi:hypothetical protein
MNETEKKMTNKACFLCLLPRNYRRLEILQFHGPMNKLDRQFSVRIFASKGAQVDYSWPGKVGRARGGRERRGNNEQHLSATTDGGIVVETVTV